MAATTCTFMIKLLFLSVVCMTTSIFFEWIIFSLTNNNNSEILQYNNINNNIFINYRNFLGSFKLKVIFQNSIDNLNDMMVQLRLSLILIRVDILKRMLLGKWMLFLCILFVENTWCKPVKKIQNSATNITLEHFQKWFQDVKE